MRRIKSLTVFLTICLVFFQSISVGAKSNYDYSRQILNAVPTASENLNSIINYVKTNGDVTSTGSRILDYNVSDTDSVRISYSSTNAITFLASQLDLSGMYPSYTTVVIGCDQDGDGLDTVMVTYALYMNGEFTTQFIISGYVNMASYTYGKNIDFNVTLDRLSFGSYELNEWGNAVVGTGYDLIEGVIYNNFDLTLNELGYKSYHHLYSQKARYPTQGTVFSYKGCNYKITKSAAAGAQGECIAVSPNGSDVTISDMAEYIDFDGYYENGSYLCIGIDGSGFKETEIKSLTISAEKINSIPSKFLKKCKKLKTVKITSSNLKSIGNNAFEGCANLKNLRINSLKLKKVGKNALKDVKKVTIKVKKKKVKSYKKLFNNKGCKKVTISKL